MNNLEVARLLLAKGAPVNPKDGLGITPLIVAAWNGDRNAEMVQLLLKHGANPNAATGDAFEIVKNGPLALGRLTAVAGGVPAGQFPGGASAGERRRESARQRYPGSHRAAYLPLRRTMPIPKSSSCCSTKARTGRRRSHGGANTISRRSSTCWGFRSPSPQPLTCRPRKGRRAKRWKRR